MSADNASQLPVELVDHLREVKSWVRWQWLLRGFGRIAMLVSLSLVTVFLLDFRLDLNPTARVVALWSIGAATSIALVGWLVIPLCRRIGWSELAALADKAHPEWEGSLTSAVELFDPSQPDSFKGSPVMRQMLLEQTRQRVEELDLERVVSSRRAWSSVKLGLAACLMLAAPVFFSPSAYRQLWQRLLIPSGNWGTVGAWQIEVVDGDRVVARGADVELLAKATKPGNSEPPKSLMLEWRDSVGTTDRRAMPYDAARQAFATTVPHVMRDLRLHVSVERQRSRDYQVQVVEPPVVTQVRVDVEPPAYSGWPAQSLDGAVGAIRVFERSRLTFKLEFNKPIETASLNWRHGGEPLTFELAANKQTASLEMLADPKVIGPYSFAIADIHRLTNNDIVPRELIVVVDEPPHLVVKGDQSTEVRPDDVVPIDVVATDDIGVGQLELHFEINKGETQKILAENVQGQKQVEQRFTLDLRSLKVEQGQWLTYKIRTTDERPDPEPHEVWSDLRVLRISTKAPPPGFNDLAKTQEELRQELKQLQNDVVQRQRELEAQRKQAEIAARTNKEPLPNDRLQQLEQQINELKQRSEKLADQLAADPLFHELGEQVRDVAEQQLPAAAQEVKQAQQDNAREQVDELRRGEQQLADAAKKLQQIEKPFQQLAELQKDLLELNRLARQAEQLANRADDLNREQAANEPRADQKPADSQNADPQEQANQKAADAEQAQKLAADEKQLAKDQAKLANALEDLLKRRPELLNAAKRDELDRLAQLAEQAKELAKEQQELADALKDRQQAAAESAKELAARQEDLNDRAEKAAADAQKQTEPNAVKPTTPEPLREAAKALNEGNLDKAQKQQEVAANELDRLAAELEKAKADAQKKADQSQSPLAKAARELADEQKKLGDKTEEGNKSDSPEQRQQVAEELNREQAAINERIENLPKDKPAEAEKKKDEPEEDTPSVLELRLVGAQNEPQDIRNFGKTLGLVEPLIREDLLGKFDYANLRYDRAPESPVRQMIWNTSDSSKLFAVPLQVAGRFERDNLQGRVGQHIRVVSPGRETSNYPLYEVDSKFVKQLPFPLATLANEPNLGELRPLPARLRDRVKELAQDSDGTPAGIARRLCDELRTRGGFHYMKRKEVEADIERPQDVEDFVFNKKKGHCEYFADALTSMLRAANIPARPVGGFKGGIYKEVGDKGAGYLDVREQHAHAWVEAFLDGHWVILDGTPGSGSSQGARQEAENRAEQAQQALAEANLDKASQEQRATEQALRELAKQATPPKNDGSDKATPEQLTQLAEEQRQLAKDVAQALNKQRGEQPQKDAAQPTAANGQASDKSGNEPGPQAPRKPVNQPQEQSGDQPNQQSQPAQQQRQLAEQAKQLAQKVGQELGEDSAEAKQAQQAADESTAAQQKSDSGQFAQAAKSGQQAAKSAEQLAQSLQQNPQVKPELGQQANELAMQQQKLGEEFDQQSQTPEATAQQQRQEQLKNATEKLGEQLAQAQQRLGQKPLNMQKPADGAQAAKQQAVNSQENMQAAQQADKSGNPGEAAQSAKEAAQQLEKAAENAQAAADRNQPSESPVPSGVGEEVAKAAESLRQASESKPDSQNKKSSPGQQGQGQGPKGQGQSKGPKGEGESKEAGEGQSSGQSDQGQSEGQGKGESKSTQGKGEKGRQGPGDGQSSGDGQGSSSTQEGQGTPSSGEGQSAEGRPYAEAARLLREAARSLANAAKQSSPRPSQGGQPQLGQPSNEPNGSPQMAQAGGGGNGQGNLEPDRGENLNDLPAQVKKVTGRNWGQLSSKLQSELTQSAKHQAHGDYSKLIKLYFQEIAKTQRNATPEKKP